MKAIALRGSKHGFLRGRKWRVTRSMGIKLNNKESLSFDYFEKRKKFATKE